MSPKMAHGILGSVMGDFTSSAWYLDGVLLPNETNYYITNITQNGEYVVEVENDYGLYWSRYGYRNPLHWRKFIR